MNRFRLIAFVSVLSCMFLTGAALAQSISVVSGNGQVLSPSNLQPQPMVVQVTDANGAAVAAGVSVNWVIASGYGFFLLTGTAQGTTTTDVNGQSSAYFSFGGILQQPDFTLPYVQSTLTATLANNTAASVTFTITQVVSSPNPSSAIPGAYIYTTIPDSLQGAAGTRGSAPVQVSVYATNGQVTHTVANAAVQLLNYQDPAQGPAITCVSGGALAGINTVLTDANGNASCTPLFGGIPGTGKAAVAAGGVPSATVTPSGLWQRQPDPSDPTIPLVQASAISQIPFSFKVTPGSPGNLKVTAGDKQSANPGQSLTAPLVAEVDDATGQPLAGIPVTWKATPANAVNFANQSSASDVNGKVSATVSLTGVASGAVQVTVALASDATKTATFTITAIPLISVTGLTIVSGNNQSVPVSTAFNPLVVQVNTSSGSAANIPVQFAVTSGPVTLSATTVNTDANGRAQVNVTAGTSTGSATVTATVSGNTQTFSLTVLPAAPPITAANFVNGADLQANSLSPCSLGAVQATAGTLGATGSAPTFPGIPLSVTNVRLTVGNLTAPILGVGTNLNNRDQITFQVPCGVVPGASVAATLTIGGSTSNVNLAIQPASPGLFTTLNSDGVYRVVLVRPDGSFVNLENPARRGETEVAFVTGLGPTTPPIALPSVFGGVAVPPPSGSVAQAYALAPQGTVIVGMAGQGVPLNYARLSEDIPGVFIVSFQIPSGIATGNNVSFSIGLLPAGASTAFYSATTKIPIQ